MLFQNINFSDPFSAQTYGLYLLYQPLPFLTNRICLFQNFLPNIQIPFPSFKTLQGGPENAQRSETGIPQPAINSEVFGEEKEPHETFSSTKLIPTWILVCKRNEKELLNIWDFHFCS